MSYLLIDWEKGFFEANLSAPEAEKIWVFAKKKTAIRQAREWVACLNNARLVCVPKNKKIARKMAKKWQKILEKDANAQIWIVSQREKVARYLDDTLNDYPDASVVLWEQSWAEDEHSETPEYQEENQETQENQEHHENQEVMTSDSEDSSKPNPEIPEMPEATEPERKSTSIIQDITSQEQKNFQAALALLKKTRPKKKDALVQTLATTLRINPAQANHIIQHLESHGMLSVDITQNIRYFCD